MAENETDEQKFANKFKRDYSYYDVENVELKKILSLVDLKNGQKLIDLGAGVGRLSVPLSKHVVVTAIDSNRDLLNLIDNTNIRKVNEKIENFFPQEKFDFALMAWPQFSNHEEVLKHLNENILKENGRLIVIKSDNHSLKEIARKLFPDFISARNEFLQAISKYFQIVHDEVIETNHTYPDIETALELFRFELATFYQKEITANHEETFCSFVKERERQGQVVMNAQLRIMLCNPH